MCSGRVSSSCSTRITFIMYAQSQKIGKQKRLKVLGVRKSRDMHMVATIGTGHLYQREENSETMVLPYDKSIGKYVNTTGSPFFSNTDTL